MSTIPERLASVETEVASINHTVKKIDGNVDKLLAYMNTQKGRDESKADTSVFRRWVVPAALTAVNVLVGLLSFISNVIHPKVTI